MYRTVHHIIIQTFEWTFQLELLFYQTSLTWGCRSIILKVYVYRFCTVLSDGGRDATSETSARVQCVGRLDDFASILSPAFRAATVFVGISVIVAVIAVMAMILFCCMKSHSVFEICGTMQMLSGRTTIRFFIIDSQKLVHNCIGGPVEGPTSIPLRML